jgi:trk system potassium uptake protein TrkH
MLRRRWNSRSSFQIIILGFAFLIFAGTMLLMLPGAKAGPGHASFADALFTATSASCVTGLVVQDTGTYWSLFGQIVILALIQIGGMGIITVAMAIAILSGKKINLVQRNLMHD